MPATVKYAVNAIWVTIAISALASLGDKLFGYKSAPAFTGELVVYALFCIFPYKLARRSNAARFIYAILQVLSYLLMVGGVAVPMTPITYASLFALIPVSALTLYWLFSSESNMWFTGNRGET